MTKKSIAEHGTYFQLPIAALRIDGHPPVGAVSEGQKQAYLQRAVHHNLLPFGHILIQGLEDSKNVDAVEVACHHVDDYWSEVSDFDHEDVNHIGIALAASKLRTQVHSFKHAVEQHDELAAISGGKRQARVRTDILWDMWREWTWRDLAILIAIYAGIGSAKCRRVTKSQINAMSLGFSSTSEMNKVAGRGTSDAFLTPRQLQWTIGQLERKRLFTRQCVRRRNNWFSNSLSKTELRSEIIRQAKKTSCRTGAQADGDVKFDRALRAAQEQGFRVYDGDQSNVAS